MKKTFVLLLIGGLIYSCKKSYTCICHIPGANGIEHQERTIKSRKKSDAEAECSKTFQNASQISSYTCTLQ